MSAKNTTKGILFAVSLLTFAAHGYAQTNGESDDGLKDAVILVIRHAEKTDDGSGLSLAGQARAKAYVDYFTNFMVKGRPLKIDRLYAAADSKGSNRSRLTLEPLSQALGLALDHQFKSKHPEKLVAAIREHPPGGHYLICWHHGAIPQLLSAFGADPAMLFPKKNHWPAHIFDWVIRLTFDSNGHLLEATGMSEKVTPDNSENGSPGG